MLQAFFIISVILMLCWHEVELQLRLVLFPRRAFTFLSWFQRRTSQRILRLASFFCRFRLLHSPPAFRGPLPSQCLLLSNHQSLIDIPALMAAFPSLDLRFVAKRELAVGLPSISTVLRRGRHALIDRKGNFSAAKRAMLRVASLTDRGISIVVFPEGTRSRTGDIQPFHSAAVRILAQATTLPVLVVAVEGGHRISRLFDLWRNIRGAEYRVRALSLHDHPRSRTDVRALLETAHREISEQLEEWRAAGAIRPRRPGRHLSGTTEPGRQGPRQER